MECQDLGPCCICEKEENVRNVIMLNKKCSIPGHGWGCVKCNLASDGAVAVLCDTCLEIFRLDPLTLKLACTGYPAVDGRTPVEELKGNHEHNMEFHIDEVLNTEHLRNE